ncbi:hypothetical protein Ae168Ps1_3758 [Pseudonocardia sp. Ae168_Ps1]|nr:hypothetical protein Ae150APs1_3735 [Pseudonocardia sp. Ae150A_Ps1]OLL81352.1 hypothetical protein Ae168Ps1_3758 [Pseudonocardia sp. Ae168_Ps1]OLL84534.1 hypothetical protein Ae263Ps1_1589c [Pseudonocardia sp. Ae263_Ps1]
MGLPGRHGVGDPLPVRYGSTVAGRPGGRPPLHHLRSTRSD